MYCIICGAKFVSSCEGKTCPTCEGAVNRMFPGVSAKHLLELVKAENDGRLVVLPCKVGDKAYWVHNRKITDCHIRRVQKNRNGVYVILRGGNNYGAFAVERIGKDVFLTREAAETALEGGADK